MSVGRIVHIALVVCFWGLLITGYVAWKVRDRRRVKENEIERMALKDRLLHPDWKFYEQHLQRPVPAALRVLFADRSLITRCGLKYDGSCRISTFMPLDKDGPIDSAGLIDHATIPIAFSDCGDPIYLRPGAAEPDTVYIAYHDDPGKVLIFADSVAVMLEKLRKEN